MSTKINLSKLPFGDSTPWGVPDEAVEFASGIWLVSTPSHGGYWVAPDLYATMPEILRDCSCTKDNWFEEDCAWHALVVAYPELLPMHDARQARAALNDALIEPEKLRVCRSAAGYYLGRLTETGEPYDRISVEYWSTNKAAQRALTIGRWTLLPAG